tara:strand:- start:364 stop:570 length:207 start_codon:yes stop_codon:yes gene_type:complete
MWNMSIIREAEQYIKSKKYKLIKGIAEKLDPLEDYIQENMDDSVEKDKAIEHLTEVFMWCKRYLDVRR